jgi:hypothetical protein
MKTTQSALAKKWGVSRSSVCKYVAKGMPLEEGKAEAWLWQNVPCSKIHLGIEDARSAPVSRKSEPEPSTGKLTREESRDILAFLVELKAEGAHRRSHPEHQKFCDGVRIFSDYGTV